MIIYMRTDANVMYTLNFDIEFKIEKRFFACAKVVVLRRYVLSIMHNTNILYKAY